MNEKQRRELKDKWKPSPERINSTIILILNNTATERFKKYSSKSVGKNQAMVVNGKVFSAPQLKARIDSGILDLDGVFSEKELRKIFLPTDKRVFYLE